MTFMTFTDLVLSFNAPETWKHVFQNARLELLNVARVIDRVEKEDRLASYPSRNLVFNAFELTPLDQVKVVIIGQDPYHDTLPNGYPRAQGLSFSSPTYANVPPSLRTIYREINRTYPHFIPPQHGDLTSWSRQGVLLLNTCLTVKPGQAGSHKKIWYPFISKVLAAISEVNPECIFLLWGRQATNIEGMIGSRSIIFKCDHPSPLARNSNFVGSNHFILANNELMKRGLTPIDWTSNAEL